jgi:ECF transporter S component (folate family)
MVQMIIAMIIIALGIFIFRFYPIKKAKANDVVLAAVFIMITEVCKLYFTIKIPLFGVESLKIGIEYIPLMLAGYFLPPSYAFLIGLCCDLIGLLLVPTGFPFFGFTLVMILVCLIPSLIKENVKTISERKIRYLAQILIIVLAVGGSIYIYQLDSLKVNDTIVTLSLFKKLSIISICFILAIIFLVLINLLRKKINDKESKELSTWILSVIIVEMICTLCLTPLWLNIMYGIPFIVSLCIRIIKECAIIPIEIFVGYTLIKLIKRVQKS